MAGTITSSTGLISGINTSSIIDQLIAIDARPVTLLKNRVTANQAIQSAYSDLKDKLSGLLTDVGALVKPSTFQSASASSSNPNILGVTAKPTASPGTYTFTVAHTVSTQSAISTGYSSTTAALGISGNITVGLGGGKVTSSTNLADLNGGNGVSRGSFRITDRSGASVAVDISSAVSLDDVVNDINSANNIQVKASIGKNGLVLQDTSGGSGTLKVANVGSSTTAADLGLTAASAGNALAGNAINTVGRNSTLSSLNDGLGVRAAGTGKNDLSIALSDGSTKTVSLSGQTTLGGALDAINNASGGKYAASLAPDGKSLQIVDNTTGSGTLAVTDLNGSRAAEDLGLGNGTVSTSGGGVSTLSGTAVRASLGSVLVKNLEGGTGLSDGQISLTDRAGNTGSVLISGDSSLSDIIDKINGAGTGLVASVNSAGTGLQIVDASGGTGHIQIASLRGAAASQLGIAGDFDTTAAVVKGANLGRQYVNENTALSDLNGGKGISAGKFTITTSAGTTATVDTTGAASLGDLISAINGAAGLRVTASVNSAGNGLLLTDTSGGPGTLSVKDTTGTAAANLNIAGSAAGNNYIDGAYTKTVSIAATDSLSNIVSKLNQAGAGVNASVLNDGSPANGNRLSITASNSGLGGQFTLDSGTTGISVSNLTSAQNAAVFYGSPTSAAPILLTSSTNTISNVVSGLSLSLVSASTSPVTVNVSQSSDTAVTSLQTFVTDFNALTTSIASQTKYSSDPSTPSGILLGDSTTQAITDTLFQSINANITGAGSFTRFAQLGLTVSDGNQLSFDADAFQAAYQRDPTALQRIFTAFNTITTTATTDAHTGAVSTDVVTTAFGTTPSGVATGTDASSNKYSATTTLKGFGIAYQLQNAINKLIDPVDGAIVHQSSELDQANTQFNDRITDLNTLLDAKRLRLQTQFANMESVLAGLQTQQTALTSLANQQSSSKSSA